MLKFYALLNFAAISAENLDNMLKCFFGNRFYWSEMNLKAGFEMRLKFRGI